MSENASVFDDMHAQEIRKAYTHALLRAAYAYLGFNRGFENVPDCINDNDISRIAMLALEEVGEALVAENHFPPEEMQKWMNEAAKDVRLSLQAEKTETLGAGLAKALKEENALVSAIVLCKNNGVWPYYCTKILGYALLFNSKADKDAGMIRDYMGYYGVKDTVKKYCGLEKEPELQQLVTEQIDGIRTGRDEDAKKVELMKNAFALGFKNEKVYRGCAQCTLLAMFELLGRENGVLFQSASALSGGMALSGDGACGGYSGGILYMGSVIGRGIDRMKIDKDREAQLVSYKMAQQLRDKFLDTYGSVICADVHRGIFGRAYCLRTNAVKKEFDDAGAHTIKCTTVIGTASAWVAEILYDSGYAQQS